MNARVLHVNASRGGVPKLPVPEAHVGRLGLDGDGHREDTVHGGPHRAVALLGIEAIRRVAAEGHPIAPGTTGENLTTEGIELSELPVGTRLEVGAGLVLELSAPANPCTTIRENFSDGRFARLSILLHPSDSRMYARVLREGTVRPGDPIAIAPPADGAAADLLLLARVEAALRRSSLTLWRAAAASGIDARILDDGEIAVVAAPQVPGRWLNRAIGFALLPNLVDRALAHYAAAGTTGWLDLDPESPEAAGIAPDALIDVHAADPAALATAGVPGLVIRRVDVDEAETWARTLLASGDPRASEGSGWIDLAPHLAASPHTSLWLAEVDGTPAGTGALHTHHRTGWLRSAAVLPAFRGRGVHRALIVARARAAADAGCDLVGMTAAPGGPSAHNLATLGARRLAARGWYPTEAIAAAAGC